MVTIIFSIGAIAAFYNRKYVQNQYPLKLEDLNDMKMRISELENLLMEKNSHDDEEETGEKTFGRNFSQKDGDLGTISGSYLNESEVSKQVFFYFVFLRFH